MKKMIKIYFVVLSLILVSCSSVSKKNNGDLASFEPRPIEEFELQNGMKVLLVKDQSLPYISLSLLVHTGGSSDPAGKAGLANLVAGLLEKGTKSKSANVIANKFGEFASDFDADVYRDYSMFKAGTLSKFQDELLSIFSEIITEPSFPESEIKLLKNQIESVLAKISDNPSAFTDRLMDQYMFEGHPYGQPISGRLATVGSISRNDLLSFYSSHYRPNNAILAVVGNYDGNIKKMIETRFGKWQRGTNPQDQLPPPRGILKTQIRIVDKPEIVQTQIRIGQIGVPRNHPDYLKLRIANSILGSGFSSRLVSRVRDQLGLTYHISSQINALADTGTFEVKTFTKNQSVGQAIKETLSSYNDFRTKGVTASEVNDAKSFMVGQFPQVVETAEAWAQNLLVLRVYGVSDTYLTEFNENVMKISTDDVNAVIKKYYTPENLKIVAFSTASQIADQLKPIGNVEIKNFKDYQ